MKKLFLVPILCIPLLIFTSCPPSISEFSFYGRIILEGAPSSVTPYVIAAVNTGGSLGSYYSDLSPYYQVGVPDIEDYVFDHRQSDIYETFNCDSSGYFDIKFRVNAGTIIIAAAEGYGWFYSEPFYLDKDYDLGTIILNSEITLPSVIDEDMTLLSGHHYIVENTVQIAQNAVLTVEPGTWVRFKQSASLNVLGSLISEGNIDNWIRFTIYDYELPLNTWSGVVFSNNSDNISSFKYTIFSNAGVAVSAGNQITSIDYCVFRECNTAVSIASSDYSEISHSSIYNCQTGVECVSFLHMDYTYIFNCAEKGLSLSNYTAVMTNSVIAGCGIGIKESYADVFNIANCAVQNNQIGIEFLAGADEGLSLTYSEISNNSDYGVFCHTDAYPQIHYNNFENPEFDIFAYGQSSGGQYLQSGDISAENNYWGSTSEAVIRQKIYDKSTPGANPNLGEIIISPILIQPYMTAGPQ